MTNGGTFVSYRREDAAGFASASEKLTRVERETVTGGKPAGSDRFIDDTLGGTVISCEAISFPPAIKRSFRLVLSVKELPRAREIVPLPSSGESVRCAPMIPTLPSGSPTETH